MLSSRGQANADQLDIPFRFAQGTKYDRETNPDGLISFGTAENALMQQELEEFAKKVESFILCGLGSSSPTRNIVPSSSIDHVKSSLFQ